MQLSQLLSSSRQVQLPENSFPWNKISMVKNLDEECVCRVAVLMWSIWKARCNWAFGGKMQTVESILLAARVTEAMAKCCRLLQPMQDEAIVKRSTGQSQEI